eukprot:UN10633
MKIIHNINRKQVTNLSIMLTAIFTGLAFLYIYLQHLHTKQHNLSGQRYVKCDNEWSNVWARTAAFIFTVLESSCVMIFVSMLTFKLGQLSGRNGRTINNHLYAKLVKAITLTVIQHSSSCTIIMIPRVIEGTPLRWIYPLDFVINSCCLCLICAQIEPWNKL